MFRSKSEKGIVYSLTAATACLFSLLCASGTWASDNQHEDYVRYRYEKNGYLVTDVSDDYDPDSVYSNYVQVEVQADVPYGKETLIYDNIPGKHFENDNWDEDDWKSYGFKAELDSSAFLGKWSYHGQGSNIVLDIHKVDFEKEKIAFEYDFEYCQEGTSGNADRAVEKVSASSDRVLTEDLGVYKKDYDEGWAFSIGVGNYMSAHVCLFGTKGVRVNGIYLTKDNSYTSMQPYQPYAYNLTETLAIDCFDGPMRNRHASVAYETGSYFPTDAGLANKDGDGTRKTQSYPLYGAYKTLCATAYIGDAEKPDQDLNKYAEIRIYGDGNLLKTVTSDEVKKAGYELYFEVDVEGVGELTFDMPGELAYKGDSWTSVTKPFLNLGNLIVSQKDTYETYRFCDVEEGVYQYQSVWDRIDCMLSSYLFYDNTGLRPVFVTVPYDSSFFELNDEYEYDINESTARKYAETVYSEAAEPGSNSFLIIYFTDGMEERGKPLDKYFYFYYPDDRNFEGQIKEWFLHAFEVAPDSFPEKVNSVLKRYDAVLLLGAGYPNAIETEWEPAPTAEEAEAAGEEVPVVEETTAEEEVPVVEEAAGEVVDLEIWICPSCGEEVTGNFCSNCGQARPEKKDTWTCPECGNEAKGNFCNNCGTPASKDVAAAPKDEDIPILKTGEELHAIFLELAGSEPELDRDHPDRKIKRFCRSDTAPSEGTKTIDVSETGQSVQAWYDHGTIYWYSGTKSVRLSEDTSGLFKYFAELREAGLDGIDTGNVTDMGSMFRECGNLTSLDLSGFDTGNVTDMSWMFFGCEGLTSLDLSSFDTGNVTDMSYMVNNCRSLISLDLSSFDTGNVTDMRAMFSNCESLKSLDLSRFDTENVTDMFCMFDSCKSLTSLDLSNFNTENVKEMNGLPGEWSGMFANCESLTSLDLSSFDTGKVTLMNYMFWGCHNLTSLDLSSFDTGNVEWMGCMFKGCYSLTSLDLSSFDTGNVTDMHGLFGGCYSLTSLDLSSFDTRNVTDMSSMFSGCESLTSLDLSSFDAENVTDMSGMFYDCDSLTSLDLSSFDTRNVTDMGSMFGECYNLTSLDLSSFDTRNVTQMYNMFWACYSLTSLDLSSFDTEKVENMSEMFFECSSLTELKATDGKILDEYSKR